MKASRAESKPKEHDTQQIHGLIISLKIFSIEENFFL